MDDFAMAVAEAIVEAPVMESLEKRFRTDSSGGPVKRRLRSNAEGIYRIGGIDGLQLWMYARMAQGIGSEEEREELQTIKNCIAHSASRSRNKWIKEFDAQAKVERQEAELKRLRTEELLEERAREQRAALDPRAAIKARLENVLELTPPPIPTPVPTPDPKAYSRKRKGECGERIGYKLDGIIREIQAPQPLDDEVDWPDEEPLFLDELITEIRHESSCESTCCAPFETVVDPPVTVFITPGGSDVDMGAPSNAIGGDGFTNHETASVWDAFSGRPECSNDSSDFLQELDQEPRLRSAAMLRSLGRIREELEALPEQSELDAPVCIQLQDILVVMSQMMSRLR